MPAHRFTSGIHRHPDNSIDFDFYRTRAVALRGQARRDAARLRLALNGAAVVLGFCGLFAVVSLAASVPESRSASAQIHPAAIR